MSSGSLSPARAPAPPDPRRTPRGAGLFRAAWRWHFFASFLVVPVLLLLAGTGLIYLFRFQLEPLLHPELAKARQAHVLDRLVAVGTLARADAEALAVQPWRLAEG